MKFSVLNYAIGRLVLTVSGVVFVAGLLTSCGGADNGGGTGSRGAVTFNLVLADSQGQALSRQAAEFPCEEEGIVTIEARVLNATNALLAEGGPFECDAGEGSITSVPVGDNRVLVVDAKNEAGATRFSGRREGVSITGGQTTNAGTITLSPSTNQAPAFTSISCVIIHDEGNSTELDNPESITMWFWENLRCSLSATDDNDDILTFDANEVQDGGLVELPEFADIDPNDGNFTFYPAESDAYPAGEYNIRFSVTDEGTPPLSDSMDLPIIVNGEG